MIIPGFMLGRGYRAKVYRTRRAARVTQYVREGVTGRVNALVVLPRLVSQEERRDRRGLVFKVFPTRAFRREPSLLGLSREDDVRPRMLLTFLCLLIRCARDLPLSFCGRAHLFVREQRGSSYRGV